MPAPQRMFGYTADAIVGKQLRGIVHGRGSRGRRTGRRAGACAHATAAPSTNAITVREDGSTFYCSGVTTRLGSDATLGLCEDCARPDCDTQRQRRPSADAHDTLEAARRSSERANWHSEQEQVRGLLRALVTAQEDQRRRIARDLHDQLGQQLTALRLTLERGQQNRAAGRDPDEELERGLALIVRDHRTRSTFWPGSCGRPSSTISASPPRCRDSFANGRSTTRFDAEFRLSGFAAGHLSKEAEVTYYRIAQEALNNVLKHAHASRVDVVLETRDGCVTLVHRG